MSTIEIDKEKARQIYERMEKEKVDIRTIEDIESLSLDQPLAGELKEHMKEYIKDYNVYMELMSYFSKGKIPSSKISSQKDIDNLFLAAEEILSFSDKHKKHYAMLQEATSTAL